MKMILMRVMIIIRVMKMIVMKVIIIVVPTFADFIVVIFGEIF